MTIQEKAIEQLERISSHLSAIGETKDYTDIAIQALEQQPNRCYSCIHFEEQDGSNCYECVKDMADNFLAQSCDDCISRKAVLQIIENKLNPCTDMFKCLEMSEIKEDVEHLPSVTPKPKIGKWIDVETLDSALWHKCSECGETEFYATDFCPNCGAKMEVEE